MVLNCTLAENEHDIGPPVENGQHFVYGIVQFLFVFGTSVEKKRNISTLVETVIIFCQLLYSAWHSYWYNCVECNLCTPVGNVVIILLMTLFSVELLGNVMIILLMTLFSVELFLAHLWRLLGYSLHGQHGQSLGSQQVTLYFSVQLQ